jgi:branched-chain amino acid transport system substrate-binding protein|tara:strand:- start:78 stop:1367 length:1290 start_codon:yes stop_codon:yes gene_type:complete
MLYLKDKFIILLIFCLSLLLYGCETTQLTPKKTLTHNQIQLLETIQEEEDDPDTQENKLIKKDNEILRIGLLLPLSGEFYQIGKSLLDAAQLALEKTNNKNLEFYIIDTGEEDQLYKNLSYLINNNVDLIFGPIFTKTVLKVKEYLDDQNIPIITFSNNSDVSDRNVYVFGLTIEDELNSIYEYSINKGINRFAVIVPDNKYGNKVKNEINRLYNVNNNSSSKFIFYPTIDPDYYKIAREVSNYDERKLDLDNRVKLLEELQSESSLKELKLLRNKDTLGDLDFEAILIIARSFSELTNFISILPYYDVDPKKVKFIGNYIWGKELILKEPSMRNSYFSSLDLNAQEKFKEEYKKIYKNNPHSLAPLAYDLVGLISSLNIEHKKITRKILHSNLGYMGINGWFRFDESGRVERRPIIFHVGSDKFVIKN